MHNWIHRSYHHLTGAVATIAFVTALASPSQAQNPVDPTQSWVESHCEFVIVTAPAGHQDDFGDLGIVLHCLDAQGLPVVGLTDASYRLVRLDGLESWSVAGEETDASGRTLLTGIPGEDATVVHGEIGVEINVDGDVVLVDNGGGGIPLEMRTPDFNGDDVVNLWDVAYFATYIDCCEDTYACQSCDFDGDGCVGLADVAIFQEYLGVGGKAERGPRPPRPPVYREDEELFIGCLQHDFGADTNPETLEEDIVALPGQPFHLRFVARGFRELTGVDFAIGVPPDLILIARNTVPEFDFEVPGYADPGDERVIVTGDCATEGPLFVYDFTFLSPSGGYYNADMFPVRQVAFANCSYPPVANAACVGSPTPCEVSYIDPGAPMFISCPGNDLDTFDTVTVVMKDQEGNGVPGLAAEDFRVFLEDELGSDRAYMVRMTPQAAATDSDGELPYRFELRESCRWDTCLDLLVTVQYEACEIYARKKVRTINVVPAVSQGIQADGVVDLADVGWWSNLLYTYDECHALLQQYRCQMVTNQEIALVANHLGHICDITDVPSTLPTARVTIDQNEPNPFNPVTNLRVHLPQPAATATLRVYDVQGRLVDTIWTGSLPEGSSVFTWDGRDAAGRAVASGAYIARLRALDEEVAVRMLLLK